MGKLDRKVAVVTGGTRGLGLGIARAFVEAGARVAVGSRSESSVERAVEELGGGTVACGSICDVANREDVLLLAQRAIEKFDGFDIWVNNAGLSAPYGPTVDVPDEQFRAVLQTNIMGTYNGSRIALEHFLAQGQGKLINLLGRGDTEPVPFQNAYASSKSWIRAFTRALVGEYKNTDIGIFALNPGLVLTEMITNVDAIEGFEERMRPFETITRMWGNPPAVPAKRAVWLSSAATDGKTGIEVRVLGPRVIVTGALRELIRRTARRLGPKLRGAETGSRSLTINTVKPAFTPPKR